MRPRDDLHARLVLKNVCAMQALQGGMTFGRDMHMEVELVRILLIMLLPSAAEVLSVNGGCRLKDASQQGNEGNIERLNCDLDWKLSQKRTVYNAR